MAENLFTAISILKHEGKIVRTTEESDGRRSVDFYPNTTAWVNEIEYESDITLISFDPRRKVLRVHYSTGLRTGRVKIDGRIKEPERRPIRFPRQG